MFFKEPEIRKVFPTDLKMELSRYTKENSRYKRRLIKKQKCEGCQVWWVKGLLKKCYSLSVHYGFCGSVRYYAEVHTSDLFKGYAVCSLLFFR